MYKVNSHNEWDTLQEVILGNVFNESKMNIDLSFKLFFHDNIIGQDLLGCKYDKNVPIKKQYIEEMKEDLELFNNILKDFGVIVHRPKKLSTVEVTKTPYWKSTNFHALNVRDNCIIIGDDIIESSPNVRFRYFENDLMKHIFHKCFLNGSKWSTSPKPMILDSSFDLSYIENTAIDSSWFEKIKSAPPHEMSIGHEIMWDGANCMRFGDTILFNVSTDNHRLGAKWLQKHLGTKYKVVTTEICDSHIDSSIVPLRPGLLLVDWNYFDIKKLPSMFKGWDIVEAPKTESHKEYEHDDYILASDSIDINVLSLDQNTIVCHDEYRKILQKKLKPYDINCIPCQFRHSRIMSGSFHCTTLDLRRKSKLENYF